MKLVFIEYEETPESYKVSFSRDTWPYFQEVMNTGGEKLGIKFIFEKYGDQPTTTTDDIRMVTTSNESENVV